MQVASIAELRWPDAVELATFLSRYNDVVVDVIVAGLGGLSSLSSCDARSVLLMCLQSNRQREYKGQHNKRLLTTQIPKHRRAIVDRLATQSSIECVKK